MGIGVVLKPFAGDTLLAEMSEARHFVRMARRAPIADVAILVATFFLTVFADLVIAVNVGVLLATLHFLGRMASSVTVQRHVDQAPDEYGYARPVLPTGAMAFSIEGPYFFAAVDSFERTLTQTGTNPRVLIVRLGRVPFMDITGLHSLEDVIQVVATRGTRVTLCEATPQVKRKFVEAIALAAELTHEEPPAAALHARDVPELVGTPLR